MPTTNYPHIEKPIDGPAHLARWPRIRVAQIAADHIGYGWSAEEILRQYPHLCASEVHASLAYYFDHLDEISRELEAELGEAEFAASVPASALRLRLLAARIRPAA